MGHLVSSHRRTGSHRDFADNLTPVIPAVITARISNTLTTEAE